MICKCKRKGNFWFRDYEFPDLLAKKIKKFKKEDQKNIRRRPWSEEGWV